jgi:hypothetical protein
MLHRDNNRKCSIRKWNYWLWVSRGLSQRRNDLRETASRKVTLTLILSLRRIILTEAFVNCLSCQGEFHDAKVTGTLLRYEDKPAAKWRLWICKFRASCLAVRTNGSLQVKTSCTVLQSNRRSAACEVSLSCNDSICLKSDGDNNKFLKGWN